MGVLDIYGFEIFEVRRITPASNQPPFFVPDNPTRRNSDHPNILWHRKRILPRAVCVNVLAPVCSLSGEKLSADKNHAEIRLV